MGPQHETETGGFSLSESDDAAYAELFERHGAEYWRNFTTRVRAGSSRPTQCLPWDRHWNHEGNRIAGKIIAEQLRAKPITAKQDSGP